VGINFQDIKDGGIQSLSTFKNRLIILLCLTIILFSLSCSAPQEPGTLQGTVTIGPIQPVVRPGEEIKVPCAVYEARKIMVYDRSGKKLLKQVDIDCDGKYVVSLAPGTYTVDTNHLGIDHSGDVPKTVEIKSGIIIKLDIDIDTGIR
jgi:hypothetical protein